MPLCHTLQNVMQTQKCESCQLYKLTRSLPVGDFPRFVNKRESANMAAWLVTLVPSTTTDEFIVTVRSIYCIRLLRQSWARGVWRVHGYIPQLITLDYITSRSGDRSSPVDRFIQRQIFACRSASRAADLHLQHSIDTSIF